MEPALAPGSLLGGRYRIESFIGASEFGEVYAALDLQSARECAIKLLPARLIRLPSAWNAFQELSRKAAAVDSHVIARASDFGIEAKTVRPLVVSERIGFPSVANLVETRRNITPESWALALDAYAAALDAAAKVAVFHGDLKPENLFFSPEQPTFARITDFGMHLVRNACSTPASAPRGPWAAAEQPQMSSPSSAGDVFSLGLVTFYALTGLQPLAQAETGNAQAVRLALQSSASTHARELGRELPPVLDAWFARALHPDPVARFAGAREAAEAFRVVVEKSIAAAATAAPSPAPAMAAPVLSNGVAAAVAAPLLYQNLSSAPVAPAPSAAAEAHLAFPLPAPREFGSEYVAGMPSRAPVQLFIALGIALVMGVCIGGYALVSALKSSPKPAASARVVPSAVPPSIAAATPMPVPSEKPEPPRKGEARFVCSPSNCESIVCDGRAVRKAASEATLSPGKHTCTGARRGFRSTTVDFELEAGSTSNVSFELVPLNPNTAKAIARPSTKAAGQATPSKAQANTKTSTTANSKTSSTTPKAATATPKAATATPKAATATKSGASKAGSVAARMAASAKASAAQQPATTGKAGTSPGH